MARKDKPTEVSEIRAAREELTRMGVLVDSGERRWSEDTKSYEIVWTLANAYRKLH